MITIAINNTDKTEFNTTNDALSALKDNNQYNVAENVFENSLSTMRQSVELALNNLKKNDWEL